MARLLNGARAHQPCSQFDENYLLREDIWSRALAAMPNAVRSHRDYVAIACDVLSAIGKARKAPTRFAVWRQPSCRGRAAGIQYERWPFAGFGPWGAMEQPASFSQSGNSGTTDFHGQPANPAQRHGLLALVDQPATGRRLRRSPARLGRRRQSLAIGAFWLNRRAVLCRVVLSPRC